MRLTEEQRNLIQAIFNRLFNGAELYLFGSRTDDSMKGGDIDLMIISENKFPLNDIIKFKVELIKQIGDQKIDIISFGKNDDSPFFELIKQEAVRL